MTIHSVTISKTGFVATWKCGASLSVPANSLAQARAFAVRYLTDLR